MSASRQETADALHEIAEKSTETAEFANRMAKAVLRMPEELWQQVGDIISAEVTGDEAPSDEGMFSE